MLIVDRKTEGGLRRMARSAEVKPAGGLFIDLGGKIEQLDAALEEAATLYRSPPPRDIPLNLDGITKCQRELARGVSRPRPANPPVGWSTSSTTARRPRC